MLKQCLGSSECLQRLSVHIRWGKDHQKNLCSLMTNLILVELIRRTTTNFCGQCHHGCHLNRRLLTLKKIVRLKNWFCANCGSSAKKTKMDGELTPHCSRVSGGANAQTPAT